MRVCRFGGFALCVCTTVLRRCTGALLCHLTLENQMCFCCRVRIFKLLLLAAVLHCCMRCFALSKKPRVESTGLDYGTNTTQISSDFPHYR